MLLVLLFIFVMFLLIADAAVFRKKVKTVGNIL